MEQGTKVKNKKTGKVGVVINDFLPPLDCCGPGEILVVYEGTNYGNGTQDEELEVIGPEDAKADLKKCGGGKGEKCCIFLSVGPSGPECLRFGFLRNDIIFRADEMNSKRHPEEMYPDCQIF